MTKVGKLGDLVSFRTGKLNSNAAKPDGAYPFFTCSQETYRTDTYSFDTECVLLAGNNANGVYPIKYFSGRFDAYQRTYVIESQDPRIFSVRYLYYALQLQLEHLRSISTGAATKFLTLSLLKGIEIRVPAMREQRRIASILSAYDDLIENNTRRIAILEEMARRIYEEWFVHFRYPGHDGVRMIESELGPIPENWEVKIIGDMFDFVGGAQPPKAEHIYEQREGYVRFVQNRDYSSQAHLTYIRANKKNKLCGRLDIMIDKYGEAGQTRFGIAGAYNVALAKILPHDSKTREWLRGFLSRGEFRQYLASASQAATRPSLNSAHFRVPVAVPPDAWMRLWQSQARPLLELILNLHDANANLRTTRDLLLPKLISGELDVSALPEPEAVAA